MVENKLEGADFTDLSSEILMGGNSIRFKAYGSSMLPWIKDGDLLTIQPFDEKEIRVGHVVLYPSAAQRPIVHRAIRIHHKGAHRIIVLRGDASPKSEEQIQAEKVLGRVVRIHRGSKAIEVDHNVWWRLASKWPRFLHVTYLLIRLQKRFRRYIVLSPREHNH
jgi:signal peptidase I